MSDSTVIFLTGANRGLGKGLVQKYLLRPNHTVIGSVRDKTSSVADELKKLPTAAGSRLLLVKIESTSPADPAEAIKDLQAAGIDHLDIVIANAGGVTGRTVTPVDTVSKEELTESFNINTLGPVFLFQAVKPLLQKSKSPVWVAVTSATGSIGGMEAFGTHNLSAYGIAKAGLNWFTMAVHCSEKWLTAFVLHPGFVQTESGNMAAQDLGMEKALHTTEQSVNAMSTIVDQATREKSSGKFYNVIDNTELPW